MIVFIVILFATFQVSFGDANQPQKQAKSKAANGFGSSVVFPVTGDVYPKGSVMFWFLIFSHRVWKSNLGWCLCIIVFDSLILVFSVMLLSVKFWEYNLCMCLILFFFVSRELWFFFLKLYAIDWFWISSEGCFIGDSLKIKSWLVFVSLILGFWVM